MRSMDALFDSFKIDPAEGLTTLSSKQLAGSYFPALNPDLGALILDLGEHELNDRVREVLHGQYPDTHRVSFVKDFDGPAQEIAIGQLKAEQEAIALYLPPLPDGSSFEALQDTVAHLRAPEGCPWDQEQTHRSLRKHLLEEAYETLEAIDEGRLDDLREELGDLLLQILMHAQIAHESARFRMADVVSAIQAKLIRRHPHVFGDVEVEDVDHVLTNWEHYKSEESSSGPLDGVPRSLPALAQAAELQDRAGRVGFSWPSIEEVLDKVKEELEELESETGSQKRAAELGDFLFAIVNYARWIKADPEAELQRACLRFRARFSSLLENVSAAGHKLEDLELAELLRRWNEAKSTTA